MPRSSWEVFRRASASLSISSPITSSLVTTGAGREARGTLFFAGVFFCAAFAGAEDFRELRDFFCAASANPAADTSANTAAIITNKHLFFKKRINPPPIKIFPQLYHAIIFIIHKSYFIEKERLTRIDKRFTRLSSKSYQERV